MIRSHAGRHGPLFTRWDKRSGGLHNLSSSNWSTCDLIFNLTRTVKKFLIISSPPTPVSHLGMCTSCKKTSSLSFGQAVLGAFSATSFLLLTYQCTLLKSHGIQLAKSRCPVTLFTVFKRFGFKQFSTKILTANSPLITKAVPRNICEFIAFCSPLLFEHEVRDCVNGVIIMTESLHA